MQSRFRSSVALLGLLIGCGDSSTPADPTTGTGTLGGTTGGPTAGGMTTSSASATSASTSTSTAATTTTSGTTGAPSTTGPSSTSTATGSTATSGGADGEMVSNGSGGSTTTATTAGTNGGFDGEFPSTYEEEDTGGDCPAPPLPAYAELPEISYLPDPFSMTDGTRITSREQWRCRRAEIKAQLEEYGAGEKPGPPSTFEASLNGNTIDITVGEGENSFQISATIARPSGAPSGPIPAIIGINAPTGSLPGNVFSSRGIATITYQSEQLAPNSFGGADYAAGNFAQLYPDSTAGYMVRWAWGISRLIDALYELPEANIDVTRLAVSGCSFQGKIALYAGAFDERIALTLPQESGGGGTISWRYSHMLEERDNTEVENLMHAQGAAWYSNALREFSNTPDKLPYDHHELIAMIAPRAVLAIESTNVARMGAEAARIDALAAREIWTALGVPFRMGATEENIAHCSWHDGFTPDLEAYVDKYLLGDESVDTDILRSQFTNLDTDTWIPWDTPTLE